MMTKNQQLLAQKDELIARLSWHHGYGCYNKAGFAEVIWPEIAHIAKWIVYFDVDGVHDINEKHETYDVFDAMMKDVFSTLRRTDQIGAQVKSGDEFLVCMTESISDDQMERRQNVDPEILKDKLIQALAKHGLTAHFLIVPVKSLLLEENIKPAADEVLRLKKARGVSR